MEFKESCERCAGHLGWVDTAYVCSSECTYCPDCFEELAGVCPNCSGELSLRPRRTQPLPSR